MHMICHSHRNSTHLAWPFKSFHISLLDHFPLVFNSKLRTPLAFILALSFTLNASSSPR